MSFTALAEGGEYNHTLNTNEMPQHSHGANTQYHYPAVNSGSTYGHQLGGSWVFGSVTQSVSIWNTGGSQGHNNVQPYIVVYFWRRTA